MHSIETYDNQRFFVGDDFASDIKDIFSDCLRNKKILLVTGLTSFTATQYASQLQYFFNSIGAVVVSTLQCGANPTAGSINSSFVPFEADIIFAIGGGSVIDVAKKIKIDFLPEANLVCIYTRLGSGTVVTPFYIFDNEEFKIGEHSYDAIPSIVYASIQLIDLVSPQQRLTGLCDIFSHAIESYLSEIGSDEKKQYALSVVYSFGNDILSANSSTVLELDIQAALAESECLVLLPHAIGHYLTYTTKLPHGLASILALPSYLNYLREKEKIDETLYTHSLSVSQHLIQQCTTIDTASHKSLLLSNVEQSYLLIQKYMPFALEQKPSNINQKDYTSIIESI